MVLIVAALFPFPPLASLVFCGCFGSVMFFLLLVWGGFGGVGLLLLKMRWIECSLPTTTWLTAAIELPIGLVIAAIIFSKSQILCLIWSF